MKTTFAEKVPKYERHAASGGDHSGQKKACGDPAISLGARLPSLEILEDTPPRKAVVIVRKGRPVRYLARIPRSIQIPMQYDSSRFSGEEHQCLGVFNRQGRTRRQ